jgi:peptide/nickel transport system substrate-binding protein
LRKTELVEYVAGQLRSIGLDASSQSLEQAQFDEQAYNVPWADVPPDRGWLMTSPHGNEMMDLSRTAGGYYMCNGGSSSYCDEELDAAINEASPLTGEEREEAFQEIQRIVYEAFALIPVIHMELNFGLSENLEWTPRLDDFMLLKEMTLRS